MVLTFDQYKFEKLKRKLKLKKKKRKEIKNPISKEPEIVVMIFNLESHKDF